MFKEREKKEGKSSIYTRSRSEWDLLLEGSKKTLRCYVSSNGLWLDLLAMRWPGGICSMYALQDVFDVR